MLINENKNIIDWRQYGRIAVFIDVANVIYSLRDLGWRIDYKKLQKYFKNNVKLVDTGLTRLLSGWLKLVIFSLRNSPALNAGSNSPHFKNY